MDVKKASRQIRTGMVKDLPLSRKFERDFTGTYIGRRIDLQKLRAAHEAAQVEEPEKPSE